jgi:hypothetical protein
MSGMCIDLTPERGKLGEESNEARVDVMDWTKAPGTLLTLCAIALGCGSETTERSQRDESVVCAQCVAGGETTDFGGSTTTPTPCQESEVVSPIDLEQARALGFDGVLARLEQSFETPFEWIPLTEEYDLNGGQPARGFVATTTALFAAHVTSVDHVVPSLAGCDDSVIVHLDVSFKTTDGAIEISGEGRAGPLSREQELISAWAALDLAGALGSLELYPKTWETPLAGYLYLQLGFWLEDVRGSVSVGLYAPRVEDGSESAPPPTYRYHPLDGHFPIDACSTFQRPLSPTDPGALQTGGSALDWRDELKGILARELLGSWGGAATTPVTVVLGEPSDICKMERALAFRLGLEVQSGDGRIDLAGEAIGSTGFDENDVLSYAWLEIYDDEPILVRDFASTTGISGVDFGDLPAAIWHTELYFAQSGITDFYGEVVVEGVDLDGRITGVEYAITGPLASFDFR